MRLRKLELSEAILARLRIVEIGRQHVGGNEDAALSPSGLDALMQELGEEITAEVARQDLACQARVDAEMRDVRTRPVGVVEVELRRKRRRRA